MPHLRLPGLIDVHVHLREPGGGHKENFETGTRAALAGGVTMVLAMPNTQPPLIDTESLALAEQAAAARALCDYGLYLGASGENIESAAALAPRTAGLKFYLDATFGPLHIKDLRTLREHFARWPKDHPIACHAEDRTIAAVLACAHIERRPVHICHVSRADEITLIRDAKEAGIAVTCEVCPHHLFLTLEDDARRLGPGRHEVRPRLATRADKAALWANMAYIDVIATDHAPHTLAEKDGPNPPPGFPGLETSLGLMLSAVHAGRLTLEDVITRMHANPKRIFNLPDQPDTYIELDPDAVWLPTHRSTISRCGWTPYDGWELRGPVQTVVLRGKTVYDDGAFLAAPGSGQNIRFSP